MIWLISGSREFPDERLARAVLRTQFKKDDIVCHGGARGVDTWAGEEAEKAGCKIKVFPAQWEKLGKSAGIQRNNTMFEAWQRIERLRVRRALIFWDGLSMGTKHMLDLVEEYGGPLTLIRAEYE